MTDDQTKYTNIPFFTSGTLTLWVKLPVRNDDSGAWLNADQAEILEALHNWARSLITSSTHIRRTKKLVQHTTWTTYNTYGSGSSNVSGIGTSSRRLGALA